MRPAPHTSSHSDATRLVGVVSPVRLPVTTDLEDLFRLAYERLHGRLLDHAERFLDPQSAWDAVSEAFLEIWAKWTELTPEQRNDRYFFGVVQHKIYDALRRMTPLVPLDEVESEVEQRVPSPAFDSAQRDSAADVLDATLASMPVRRREVLLLIRENSMSYLDAAEALGLSLGTVKTHLRLAMDDLRRAFTQAGFKLADPSRTALPSQSGEPAHD